MSPPVHIIAGKFPTQGGRPVIVTEEQFAACCCPPLPPPTPGIASFTIQSLGGQDDDLRIRVGGVTVSDTKWCRGWYRGDTFLTKAIPPFPDFADPAYFRRITITAALMAQLGIDDARGLTVEVDVFDGWAVAWATSPWTATIEFENGTSVTKNGGSVQTGTSSFGRPAGVPYLFSIGPYFSEYHANGSFTLTL